MKFRALAVLLLCSLLFSHRAVSRDLRGRVTDRSTGQALQGALVSSGDSRTQSGADGRFELLGLSDEAALTLSIRLLGYQTETLALAGHEQPAELRIALREVVLPAKGVVVTAERQKASETPITYSSLSSQEIRDRYSVKDIPVLLSELPSTTYYSDGGNGIGYTYLNIRGFDQRRIAVMVNGVPQNDPEDHSVYWLDFPDLASNLEDIQVQRGAGSMTIGAPAIGGSINLVTTNFARRRGLYLSAGMGSFNTRKVSLSGNSGVFDDRYAVYARLSKITSDGYRDNSWVDFGSYFLGAVRFDRTMSTQVNLYGGPVADHLAYYGIPKADLKDRTLRKANPIARPEEIENFSQPHYELINEWKPSADVSLTNTVFYIKGTGFFDYDGSWAPYSYYRITPANGFAVAGDPDTLYIPGALIHAFVENNQYGWVPRVSVEHGNGTLVAGGELRMHRSEHWGSLKWGEAIPQGVTPNYKYYSYRGRKTMASAYAHELYRLGAGVMALADVQLASASYRLYDEAYVGTDFTKSYLFLNPKLGLNVALDEKTRVYATVSRTSREPQLKNLYDAAEASTPAIWGAPVVPQFRLKSDGTYDYSDPLVKEESMNAAEAGAGYTDDRAELHVNAYYMRFANEIVKSGRLDRFGQPVTGNAKATVHRGLEVSARFHPAEWMDLSGNLTVSRNTFISHTEYGSDGAPIVLDGRRIAGFPDFIGNLRFTLTEGAVSGSFALRHVGRFYTTNREEESRTVDAFTVADLSASLTLPDVLSLRALELKCEVTNVFDVLYAPNGEKDEYFPAATRSVFFTLGLEL
ncbi:MAG: TonB-dependent receptor [Acidobacteriota bacterium]